MRSTDLTLPSAPTLARARSILRTQRGLFAIVAAASTAMMAASVMEATRLRGAHLVEVFYLGALVEFTARCVFIIRTHRLASLIGAGSRYSNKEIVASFLIPIVNLFRPFAIVRDLSSAADSTGLPPVRTLVEQPGGFRDAALRERIIQPPVVPPAWVILWQLAVGVGSVAILVSTPAWAVLTVVGFVAQLWVLSNLERRYRALLSHLELLRDTQ